ncbi:MAG: CotH kinase family protein [Bacteroidales bacterium]|nr:CotH kinase family protein [Bacteroidales bacterium]
MRRIVALILSLGVVVGCMSIDIDTPEVTTVPEAYKDILEAYEQGQSYIGLEYIGADRVRLAFHDRAIEVSNSDLMIYRRDEEPVISRKNRCWTVDGTSTGVKISENLSNKAAYPFYFCQAGETFNVYLSNGNTLIFPSYAEARGGDESQFTIPQVYLYVNGTVQRHTFIDGSIRIKDPSNEYSDTAYIATKMQIRGRGNTTWNSPKKPYRIKLSEPHKVLGMPSNRDWNLISNYNDKTLIRNLVGMELSRIAGMDWTPRCRVVEMYYNGEYQGLYNLFEHKEVAKNKVNINPVAENATHGSTLEGDYYVEIESSIENMVDPVYFISDYGSVICCVDPENPNAKQKS